MNIIKVENAGWDTQFEERSEELVQSFKEYILAFNQRLVRFVIRTWQYLRSKNTMYWLSKPADGYLVIATSKPIIFTLGFIKPMVFCSEGLLKQVSNDELQVLLAHEKSHINHKDSLSKWLVKTLSSCCFNQDIISRDLLLRMEQRADQAAILAGATKEELMSLILRFKKWETTNPDNQYYCAFTHELPEERIRMLKTSEVDFGMQYKAKLLGVAALFLCSSLLDYNSAQMHHLLESFWSFLIS